MVRINAGGMDFLLYFTSQEFYPFVYFSELLLLDDWANLLDFDDDFFAMLPFSNIVGIQTLGEITRIKYFSYYDYGPTVTILYPLFKYPLFAVPLFFITSALVKTFGRDLHSQNIDREYGFVGCLVYSFISLKFFLLIRNGEFSLFYWDLLFLFVLFLPLIFTVKLMKEVAK
jgi:hypothetical protein